MKTKPKAQTVQMLNGTDAANLETTIKALSI
jgi:hypothetical protein